MTSDPAFHHHGEPSDDEDESSSDDRPRPRRANLGPLDKLRFTEQCASCRLLQAIMPSSIRHPDKDVLLVPARSIHRLESRLALIRYESTAKYANLLYITQERAPSEYPRLHDFCHEAHDAVGALETPELTVSMPVRKIDLSPINTCLKWVRNCEARHDGICDVPRSSQQQHIRLIDVKTRRVVEYPRHTPCQYLCLSYVCGEPAYRLDSKAVHLPPLPATFEDALAFVGLLGQRYLWIDAICINQDNEKEKQEQIELMSIIYKGAWATIVALTATSAYSGLPRMRNTADPPAQQTFDVVGLQFATVLPTLQQQCAKARWKTRAWTHQEAVVSSRCIYFTPEQLYFECNGSQCCESLDDSSSLFHTIPHSENRKFNNVYNAEYMAFGDGVFRDPVADVNTEKHLRQRLGRYDTFVCAYTERDMTDYTDVLRACSAVLNRFEQSAFKKGFFYGLPTECLPYALLWHHKDVPTRRNGFPSWSWAGWIGSLETASSVHNMSDRRSPQYQPPVRAWALADGVMKLLYSSYPCLSGSRRWHDRGIGYDPIYDEAFSQCHDLSQDIVQYRTITTTSLLLDVLTIQLPATQTVKTQKGMWGDFQFRLNASPNSVICSFKCLDQASKKLVDKAVENNNTLRMLLLDRWFRAELPDYGWQYDLLLVETVAHQPRRVTRRSTQLPKIVSVHRVGCVRMHIYAKDYPTELQEGFRALSSSREFVLLE